MFDLLFSLFQTKEEKVKYAKQKFFDALKHLEIDPLNENLLSKSYELGFNYEATARKFGVKINASRDGCDRIKDISIAHFRGLQKLNPQSTKLKNDKLNEDEVMVVISGNWGDIPMTLTEWIKKGPGMRFLRRPFRAWNLRTGDEMSLEDIPIQYRNDEVSRRMIENGELENPWNFETDY
jgi:hypothetical protein